MNKNEDKSSKTKKVVGLGVKVDAQLKDKFSKECDNLKYSNKDVIESLMNLFLSLDKNTQSAIVRREVEVVVKNDDDNGKRRSILSLLLL